MPKAHFKQSWVLLGLLGLSLCVLPTKSEAEVEELKVKGMVCSFCAQGIEKKIKSYPEVQHVQVDLKNKTVRVDWGQHRSRLSEQDYRQLFEDAGYALESIRMIKEGEK